MKKKDPLSFDLELAEISVTIAGDKYTLRELDGKQRDKYLTNLGQRLVASKDGKSQTVKNFDGLHASLICMCLYKDGEDKPVAASTIQGWPARVVSALFDEAKKISGIKDDEEDEEGKD